MADTVEKRVSEALRRRVSLFRSFGIKKVLRVVRQDKRLKHIKSVSKDFPEEKKRRALIYEQAKRLLSNYQTPEQYPFCSLQSVHIDLSKNWQIKNAKAVETASLVYETRFKKIAGKINAVVGSFVFINESVYDFDSLVGYVIECQ